MKKIIYLAVFLAISSSVFAQTFTEDFESFSVGDYVAAKSSKWTTWGNAPGTSQDVKVINTKAHSGSNAIYLWSTASKGGPQDLVLPLPGTYNTGTFSFETYMFIDADSSAYLNFQSKMPVGTEWALSIFFNPDGTVECQSNSGQTHHKTTYPKGTWFNYKIAINLNTNTWEVFVDYVSKGSFASKVNQVAAIDFYPNQGGSFYIDDVVYTYTTYTLPALNVGVIGIGGLSGFLAGQQAKPYVVVRNLGTQNVTSYTAEINYNGTTVSANKSSINLSQLGYDTVWFSNPIAIVPGKKDAVATVKNVNGKSADDDASDDSKTMSLDPVVPAANKAVVAEEGTGTWCGWCVRGAVYMDLLHDKFGELFVPIAIHNGKTDPMRYQPYDSMMGLRISGYPSAIVDRGKAIDPSAIEPDFLKRIVQAPAATLINGAQYDASSRTLDVSVTTTFAQAISGDYRIAVVLTEDSIHSLDPAYKQANYYAGGNSGEMGGYENLPNPVPASLMWYNHVARYISPNFNGEKNSYPATVNVNDQFTHNVKYTINSAWNLSKVNIIGMIIDPNGKIDNAFSCSVDQAKTNGFVSGKQVSTGMELSAPLHQNVAIYPNPTHDQLTIYPSWRLNNACIRLYSLTGQLVYEKMGLMGEQFTFDVSALSPGIYSVELNQGDMISRVKLIRN